MLCGVGLELHHCLYTGMSCHKSRLRGGLKCKLMLMVCVEIVHTNLYNCIRRVPDRIQYLELFDTASHVVDTRKGIRS